MTVYDLNPDQLTELKEAWLDGYLLEVEDRCASYEELANAGEIVPDEIVFRYYEGYTFSEDDFCCSAWGE